jgi:serine/threonine protein kinase
VGVPPYYSFKQEEIYQSILSDELSFPSSASLSPEITSLLSGLLDKDPKHRLGCLYGMKEIMCHPWIGKIRREAIENKMLTPPFVPDLHANNFDEDEIKVDMQEMMGKLEEDRGNGEY